MEPNILPIPTDRAGFGEEIMFMLAVIIVVLVAEQLCLCVKGSAWAIHATSHQLRLSLFSESALKHFCSHVHSLLNFDSSVHRLVVSKFLNCRPL